MRQRRHRPMQDMDEQTPDARIYEGECKPLICGLEAACRPFKNNTYICICPHDSSPPTKDLRCPNRLTVPLTPRPIHNIIPPSGANLTANGSISNEVQHAKQLDVFQAMTVVVGSGVACLLLTVLLVVCCCKHKLMSRCLTKSQHKNQDTPMSLNKGLLSTDRYALNPQYIPCAMPELLSPFSVTLVSRERIIFHQEIGEGCFGKVYKGELKHEDNVEIVAIKVLKEAASKEAEEDFMREVEIMSSFKHSNILSLIGVALKEPNKSPWMIFEFMPHGDLTEVLRSNSRHLWNATSNMPRLSKDSLHSIALQIAKGMAYLAAQRFVHRDLACRNCLVGDNLTVKIADFGMSRDVYTCDYYKIGGSRLLPVRWMSPESVMYGRFTLESDVWSYGVVLWEIYSLGKQPYFGHCNEEVVRLILQGIMLIPPEDCPPVVCELMRSCWKTEPRDRTNFNTIQDALSTTIQSAQSTLNSDLQSTLPRPPAFPVTLQTSIDILDTEYYLQPLPPPGPAREYMQPLPD
uniref:Protein kinase domain-containing protein n=1 Tax=Clastoptera arizonana TaxID=38151 RepID=A0A1B6CKF4_9HEMI